MNTNHNLIMKLRSHVMAASLNPDFVHHKWYSKYHLEIVERISSELCAMYNHANRELTIAMVWLHDYGKMVGCEDHLKGASQIKSQLLNEMGFESNFIKEIMRAMELLDNEVDLARAPIEVQIVSSADGASHFVGPFQYFWWYENCDKDYKDLMQDNYNKALLDWTKKIVLPEVHKRFETRFRLLLEQCGEFPAHFI